MSARDRFEAAQPFIVGVGVPIAVLLAGLVLPLVISQGRDLQKIADAVDDLKASVSAVQIKVDLIEKRESQAERDPNELLAKVLGISAAGVSLGTVTWIDGKVVILPKTERDVERLTDGGYALVSISPTIKGYALKQPVTSDFDPVQRPGR